MKKLSILFIVILCCTSSIYAQDEFVFKPSFSPQKTYNSTVTQNVNAEVKYTASEDILKAMEDRGLKNPTITTNQTITETSTSTGKVGQNDTFPIKIQYISSKSDGKNTQIPDGTIIYGSCKIGNAPILDSIATDGLNNETKKAILNIVQQLFTIERFPEKKLKLGDEFTTESPLTIPMGNFSFDMIIISTYKLQVITNGLANFDVIQKYTLKTTDFKYKLTASGSGKGVLVYDIANHITVKTEINNDMMVSVTAEQLTLDLKTNSVYKQLTNPSN